MCSWWVATWRYVHVVHIDNILPTWMQFLLVFVIRKSEGGKDGQCDRVLQTNLLHQTWSPQIVQQLMHLCYQKVRGSIA